MMALRRGAPGVGRLRPSPAEVASRGRYSLVAAAFLAIWMGAIALTWAGHLDLGPLNGVVGALMFLAVVGWGIVPLFVGILTFTLACTALSGWSANVIGRPATIVVPAPQRRQLAWGLWGAIAGLVVSLGPIVVALLLWAGSGLFP